MKLNIGCGTKRLDGFVNIDVRAYRTVDVVCDCEKTLPFKDECFDGAFSQYFIEHIRDLDTLMLELARVCKAGSIVNHITPYCRGAGAFGIGHVTYYHERSFEKYYLPNTEPVDVRDSKPYELVGVSIVFGRNAFIQRLLYWSRVLWCGGALDFKLRVK